MTADLHIALNGGSVFEKIHPLHNGIQAEALSHFQHGKLNGPFFLQRLEIRKEVQLIASIIQVGSDLRCADPQYRHRY